MQVTAHKNTTGPRTLAGILMLAVLAGCGGGGGGGGRVTPPPAADSTFSVTLESVTATDRSSGSAVNVTGNAVVGATASLPQ